MAHPEAHLIVDGFNVIHALPEYGRLLPGSLDLACSRLVEAVRLVHDAEGIYVTVVFDGKGDRVEVERTAGIVTFSILYSPRSVTADGVIEQIVRQARHPREVTVASRDNLVAESVRSAGGICITPEDLADWVARAHGRIGRLLEQRRRQTRERLRHEASPWDALDRIKKR